LEDESGLKEAFAQQCLLSFMSHGWDPDDEGHRKRFLEEHSKAVMSLAISIVAFSMLQAERKRKWGWLGKAAALAGNLILSTESGRPERTPASHCCWLELVRLRHSGPFRDRRCCGGEGMVVQPWRVRPPVTPLPVLWRQSGIWNSWGCQGTVRGRGAKIEAAVA